MWLPTMKIAIKWFAWKIDGRGTYEYESMCRLGKKLAKSLLMHLHDIGKSPNVE